MPSLSLICSTFVIDSLEFVVGRMYVSKYFDPKSKIEVTHKFNLRF